MRACALATGQSWDKTYRELCEVGYSRKEMPSWNPTWWEYLKQKGFRRYVIPDVCPNCYTVEDFAGDHPYGAYVLFIPESSAGSGHAVSVVDGIIYDIWDSSHEIPLVYWKGANL